MNEFIFKGKDDFDFKNGNIYALILMNRLPNGMFYTIFENESNKLVEVVYSNINKFNENWEVR